ncbi:MAG: DUF1800 family protein [Bacteroidetes bacterium]|nr:MAG: DUF1800 family protein [Bacteroidota bacterium]
MASLAPKSGVLGKRLAAHLLRRATFGPTRAEIDEFAAMTPQQALDQLLRFPPLPAHPVDPETGLTWVVQGRGNGNSDNDDLKMVVNSWWLHQIFDPNLPLSAAQKIVFFLHTCFSTSWQKITYSENHYYTLRLFMHYASGSYKELAKKICLDNGMNEYLDIGESKKGNPNENFAREFLELFTIGKGPQVGDGDYTHYTEDDIREAARLLTGFRRNDDWADPLYFDPDTGLPRAKPTLSRHDETNKTFSPAFGNVTIAGRATEPGMLEEVSDLVEMIFAQPATAVTISRRLYRFFVKRTISEEVEQDIIQPLAQVLRDNDYRLTEAMRVLLGSEHFYDEDNDNPRDQVVGALIKSPLELHAGMIRFLGVPIPDPAVDPFAAYVTFYWWGMQNILRAACFPLFDPPDVAGYEPVYQSPEYNRLWISAKSLPARYEMADEHLDGPPLLQVDVMEFVTNPNNISDFDGPDPLGNMGVHQGARIAEHLVTELLEYMLPEPVTNHRYEYFLNILLDGLSTTNWMNEWDAYVATGDDSAVKPQLKKLLRSILQSPEYQIG